MAPPDTRVRQDVNVVDLPVFKAPRTAQRQKDNALGFNQLPNAKLDCMPLAQQVGMSPAVSVHTPSNGQTCAGA